MPTITPTLSPLAIAKSVIATEQQALNFAAHNLDESFADICDLLLACQGKTIVMGVGKSGHIARKISATLASTGTPSFYIHPGEACHGDMGMITSKDILIAISYSGETEEIITLLPALQHIEIPIIAMTRNSNSSLGQAAQYMLSIDAGPEACPHNLAPTSSTTATLAIGDALAITLLKMRNFTPEDFARRHPGGNLGKQLLTKVKDLMIQGEDIPAIQLGSTLEDALLEITSKRLGVTAIINDQYELQGIFTDGDLRRTLQTKADIHKTLINDVMSTSPQTISAETMATSALKLMRDKKITSIVVTEQNKLLGIIHLHDLLRARIPTA